MSGFSFAGDAVSGKSRDLRQALEIYFILQVCCDQARESISRNSTTVAEQFSELMSGWPGQPRYTNEDVDNLLATVVMPILDEICFVDLVRAFEQIIFRLVDNASGEIKAAIKRGSKSEYPFRFVADRFIKQKQDDVRNLGDVEKILKDKIHSDLQDKLTWIIKYRNWLAHGNRFSERLYCPGEIAEVVEILERVLEEIKRQS